MAPNGQSRTLPLPKASLSQTARYATTCGFGTLSERGKLGDTSSQWKCNDVDSQYICIYIYIYIYIYIQYIYIIHIYIYILKKGKVGKVPSFRDYYKMIEAAKSKNTVKYCEAMGKHGKTSLIHSSQNGEKDACIAANVRSWCLWQQPGSLLAHC